LDAKFARTIAAIQILEAGERNAGGASDELEEAGLLLLSQASHTDPEPPNGPVASLVPLVDCLLLPVVYVDFCHSSQQILQGYLFVILKPLGRRAREERSTSSSWESNMESISGGIS